MPRKPSTRSKPPEEDDEEIDLAIIFLRVALRWKQKDLAEASKIGNSSISDYERKKKNPGRKNLRKLLQAMGYRDSALELTRWYLNELRTSQRMAPGEPPASGLAVPGVPFGAGGPASAQSRLDQVPADFGRATEQLVRVFLDLLKTQGAGPAPPAPPVPPPAPEAPPA